MPKFVTPDGRADLERSTEELIEHLKQNARGLAHRIPAKEIAALYDLKLWQAHTCAFQARVQLRFEDEVLCARPGPGGGFFVAETEEEGRSYGLLRSETSLTMVENIVKDVETAIRGVVRSAPSTELYWKRTRRRLSGIAGELTKVRHELALAAGSDTAALDDGED
jgi:hypothetical protein